MLYWSLIFFIAAIGAAILGYSGVVSATAGIAQIMFFFFALLFALFLIAGLYSRPTAPPLP